MSGLPRRPCWDSRMLLLVLLWVSWLPLILQCWVPARASWRWWTEAVMLPCHGGFGPKLKRALLQLMPFSWSLAGKLPCYLVTKATSTSLTLLVTEFPQVLAWVIFELWFAIHVALQCWKWITRQLPYSRGWNDPTTSYMQLAGIVEGQIKCLWEMQNAKPLVAVLPKIIRCLIAFPALLWLRSIVSMWGGGGTLIISSSTNWQPQRSGSRAMKTGLSHPACQSRDAV